MEWRGVDGMQRNMTAYGSRVNDAVHRVAQYFAPVVEAEAKANAPWTDRTGNARQGLRGFVEDLSASTVAIYLTHSVEYGVNLELKYQGRYAIILPTLESRYADVKKMLDGIFK